MNILRSNIVDQVVASAQITETDYRNIAENVWEYGTINDTGTATYGKLVKDIDSDLTEVKVDVDKTLKKGEFLALK